MACHYASFCLPFLIYWMLDVLDSGFETVDRKPGFIITSPVGDHQPHICPYETISIRHNVRDWNPANSLSNPISQYIVCEQTTLFLNHCTLLSFKSLPTNTREADPPFHIVSWQGRLSNYNAQLQRPRLSLPSAKAGLKLRNSRMLVSWLIA